MMLGAVGCDDGFWAACMVKARAKAPPCISLLVHGGDNAVGPFAGAPSLHSDDHGKTFRFFFPFFF